MAVRDSAVAARPLGHETCCEGYMAHLGLVLAEVPVARPARHAAQQHLRAVGEHVHELHVVVARAQKRVVAGDRGEEERAHDGVHVAGAHVQRGDVESVDLDRSLSVRFIEGRRALQLRPACEYSVQNAHTPTDLHGCVGAGVRTMTEPVHL